MYGIFRSGGFELMFASIALTIAAAHTPCRSSATIVSVLISGFELKVSSPSCST